MEETTHFDAGSPTSRMVSSSLFSVVRMHGIHRKQRWSVETPAAHYYVSRDSQCIRQSIDLTEDLFQQGEGNLAHPALTQHAPAGNKEKS